MDNTELLRKYRWVRAFSFPRRFPIIQFPNNPLIAAFAAGQLASMLHGAASHDAQAISYLAMGVWAYWELTDGVNWFRHLLGLYYVFSTAVHLARALGH